VWHTPVAASRTRHSPAFGPSRSISSTSRDSPASQQTAAFTFIPEPPVQRIEREPRVAAAQSVVAIPPSTGITAPVT
jgi:hypothetical protein